MPPSASSNPSDTQVPAPSQPRLADTPHRGRILCVDDDPICRLRLATWLEHQNYQVTLAVHPDEAEELLAADTFDLIISDIVMPGNHRLEWVESLLASGSSTPVLLLTANPSLETACRAANLAVAGYIIKPPDWSQLDSILQRVITGLRHRRALVELSRSLIAAIECSPAEYSAEPTLLQQLRTAADYLGRFDDREDTKLPPPDTRWRDLIQETIDVIERTKHSFRSRELGQLRSRLKQLIQDGADIPPANRGLEPPYAI